MSIKFNDYKKLDLQDLINLNCPHTEEVQALVLAVSRLLKQTPFCEIERNSASFYFKINQNQPENQQVKDFLFINAYYSNMICRFGGSNITVDFGYSKYVDCDTFYSYNDYRDKTLLEFINHDLIDVLKENKLIN